MLRIIDRVALALIITVVVAPQSSAQTSTAVALGSGANANQLVRFGVGSPSLITIVPVTGVTAPDTLVGIDYRPADGLLYGVGVNGNQARTYVIDAVSGLATPTGAAVTIAGMAGATAFGLGFSPVADRLRLVDSLANNTRLRPDGSLAAVDTDIIGADPLVALAYDRGVAGATASTLFGIVSGGDRLVRLGGVDGVPSPNGGVLTDIGPLGVDTSNLAGFDIEGTTGAAYAALEAGGTTGLYGINLATGAAALVGTIGNGTIDLAGLALPQLPAISFAAPAVAVTEGETAAVTVTRSGALGITSTVSYATDFATGTTASVNDVTATSGTLVFAPDVVSLTIPVATTADAAVEGAETVLVRLTAPSDATLATSPLDATLTITDAPGAGVPPVGLISASTQRIDRTITVSFSCDTACSAVLDLQLGRSRLKRVTSSLAAGGRRTVTFRLSGRSVARIRAAARGAKSAPMRVSGVFGDGDGTSRGAVRFVLG